MATVKEIYKYFKGHPSMLMLSSTDFSFWEYYKNNHAELDMIFARTFANFEYFNPLSENDDIANIAAFFSDDIHNFLVINKKRFEEMYRIQLLQDNDLPMTYNYDMTENMQKSNTNNSALISGQRTDIANNQTGSQNFEGINKVTAFNSGQENTKDSATSSAGSRQDINQFTKGQETDTQRAEGSENYTLTRKGNIGVQTGADILMTFDKAMPVFDFYMKIFNEICNYCLLVGGE